MKKVPNKKVVFIVENDGLNTRLMADSFSKSHDFEFVYFTDSASCLAALHQHPMAVVVDYGLNTIDETERDGAKILKEIKKLEHHTEVIFFSTHDNAQVATEMVRHGAYDYVVINDARFVRLEKVLNNVVDYLEAKRESFKYKVFTYSVIGAIVAWTLLTIIMFATGRWESKSGVFIEP